MKKDELSYKERARIWTGKKENRLKLKTRIFFGTVIFAVVFYAGASFSLTREFIFTPENLYDIIFLIVVTMGAINDALINAEYDESSKNPDFKKVTDDIKKEIQDINKPLHFLKQLKVFNTERWHQASYEERERRIEKLEDKIAKKLEKDKDYSKLQSKIDRLRETKDDDQYVIKVPPKNFKKYKKESFLTLDTIDNEQDIDIDYKSTKIIRRRMSLFSLIRIVVFITLRIGLFAETGSAFDFFVMLGLSISSVAGAYIFTYDQVREDMSKNELYAKEQKLQKLKYIKGLEVKE